MVVFVILAPLAYGRAECDLVPAEDDTYLVPLTCRWALGREQGTCRKAGAENVRESPSQISRKRRLPILGGSAAVYG